MDLKQLFHNPEDLDDSELVILRTKINTQTYMPYYSAVFSGLTMKIVDSQVFNRGTCPRRLGGAIAFGFLVGANAANYFE